MAEMKKIGAFWKRTDKNGNPYMSGRVDGIDFGMMIFTNNKKDKESSPDYIAYLSDRPSNSRKPKEEAPKNDDSLPF